MYTRLYTGLDKLHSVEQSRHVIAVNSPVFSPIALSGLGRTAITFGRVLIFGDVHGQKQAKKVRFVR